MSIEEAYELDKHEAYKMRNGHKIRNSIGRKPLLVAGTNKQKHKAPKTYRDKNGVERRTRDGERVISILDFAMTL